MSRHIYLSGRWGGANGKDVRHESHEAFLHMMIIFVVGIQSTFLCIVVGVYRYVDNPTIKISLYKVLKKKTERSSD